MNKFLELLATEKTLDVVLILRPIGCPQLQVTINNQVLYHNQLNESIVLQHRVPLLDPLTVTVTLSDKVYGQTETAVVIEQLDIDSFSIVPAWTQTAKYSNDHNYCDPTNYLGFNGSWVLATDIPFYQWKHTVTGQGWLLQPV
jgi:hypothetical protein